MKTNIFYDSKLQGWWHELKEYGNKHLKQTTSLGD